MGGVFKSWAVTKGPSLDPHDKRLAVEVEDHPLDYGDFEGTIPKGQYGGGTVMVWDRGHWNCENAERAYRKGKLDFTLEGKKLHGGWILTRMRKREGENRTNWLLIKHRDEFAREGKKNRILDEDTSVASGRSMDEITAGKGRGPKPFVTAKKTRAPAKAEWKSHGAIARASSAKKRSRPVAVRSSRSPRKKASKKGQTASDPKMPPFIAPQLCTSVDRPPAGGEWVHEIKFDGYRIQMRIESGEVTLKTRNGLDWAPKFGANDQFSTAVAPLSPRARPHAPVSMPITWSQVKHGLDPMQYTIQTVPQPLKKSKAWSDYCDAERPPREAIARQAKLKRAA